MIDIYYTLFIVSTDFNKEVSLITMTEIEVCKFEDEKYCY